MARSTKLKGAKGALIKGMSTHLPSVILENAVFRNNFIVKQVFFCGGDHDEFEKWKKGLSSLAKDETKRKAEKTLKIEIDEEAFDRLYEFKSHPIEYKKVKKVAVRVISQFGEETMKVMELK